MTQKQITGMILAGGQALRMGGEDKGLLRVEGRTLTERIIDVIRPQVDDLIINANRNLDVYATFGFPIIEDAVGDFWGPLAGVLSVLQAIDSPYLMVVPCDMPLLPPDLVSRLLSGLTERQAEVSVPHDGHHTQHACMLLDSRTGEALRDFLASGERRVQDWLSERDTAIVDYSNLPGAFVNINTPEDLLMITDRFRPSS